MKVKFCSECANMLYPVEKQVAVKKDDGSLDEHKPGLVYECRQCSHTEAVKESDLKDPVYRHVVSHSIKDKTMQLYDVRLDPTLPRTRDWPCNECGSRDVCYFQSPVGKNDDALVLYFVCAACGSTWLSSDDKK
mmetsp:Transcript_15665/g.27470  ORF Transcript_15665/g.27470 Transcript_15665/m.27470 type:complete len:134 (-) Transcript_15665:1371-1772(-)